MRKGNPVPVLALATSCIRPCCSLPYLKVKFPDVQYRRTSPFSPPPPPACQSHLLLLLSPPSGSPSIRHCSGRKRRSRRRSRRILGDGERDGVKKKKKKPRVRDGRSGAEKPGRNPQNTASPAVVSSPRFLQRRFRRLVDSPCCCTSSRFRSHRLDFFIRPARW